MTSIKTIFICLNNPNSLTDLSIDPQMTSSKPYVGLTETGRILILQSFFAPPLVQSILRESDTVSVDFKDKKIMAQGV